MVIVERCFLAACARHMAKRQGSLPKRFATTFISIVQTIAEWVVILLFYASLPITRYLFSRCNTPFHHFPMLPKMHLGSRLCSSLKTVLPPHQGSGAPNSAGPGRALGQGMHSRPHCL